MRTKGTVTLRDIAEATGYTVNTVSRALKDKPDISRATCRKIQQAAREMGYVRNDIASSLRSGRTRTFALIIGGLTNPFYSVLADLMQREAFRLGYGLMLLCSRDDPEMELHAVEMALSRRVDGVMITPSVDAAPALSLLRNSGLPYLLLNRYMEDGGDDYVISDDEQGGFLAARHLLEEGHRKIAMLSFFPVAYSMRKRYLGFRRACREAGLADGDAPFARCGDEQAIRDLVLDWRRQGITGIFSFCDREAWTLLSILDSCGLRVPEDMAVIGYDNLQDELHYGQAICSVDGRLGEETRAAVEMLRSRIHHPELPPQRVILPVSVVCRGSCGKAAGFPR